MRCDRCGKFRKGPWTRVHPQTQADILFGDGDPRYWCQLCVDENGADE